MIATLIDKDGRVTIPGFYDDVAVVSDADRQELARAPFDMEEYKESIGIREVKGEKGFTTLERTAIRPCLDVCGIWGGYTGVGSKTVLPSEAHAKISMRIVPDQKADKILDMTATHPRNRTSLRKRHCREDGSRKRIPHSYNLFSIQGRIQGNGGSIWH